ncbi:hypothetical protein T484DRAFT_1782839, partial [Baffinella frigidus]
MASRAAAALLPRAPPAAQCSAWLRARASPLPKFCAARISTALPRATSRYMSVQPRGIALHGRRWARAASSEASPHAQDEAAARKFLMDDLGYRAALADAVIASLKAPGSGVGGGRVEAMLRSMAGRWEMGVDVGLTSLVSAVELELAAREGKALVKFK